MLLLVPHQLVFAQTKTYRIQFAETAPNIDAIDNDKCWADADVAKDFTQTIPEPLQLSRFKTEVKMCYNNNAVYVLAHISKLRCDIVKQICERDELNNMNADIFSVFFDTYNDKQNGYAFKVSSANVQQDERQNNGGSGDAFSDNVDKIIVETEKAHHAVNTHKAAVALCHKVKPLFDHVRSSSDALEFIVDDTLWQLPKYREMLFIK